MTPPGTVSSMRKPPTRSAAATIVRPARIGGGTLADPADLSRALLIAVAVLVGLDLLAMAAGEASWQLTRVFSLSREGNVPTWFSSLLWGISAWCAFGCSRHGDAPARRIWMVLAAIFLACSCDEVAMVHETIGTICRRLLALPKLSVLDVPVVLIGPVLVPAGVWLPQQIRKHAKLEPRALRRLLIGVAALAVAVAVDSVSDYLWSGQASTTIHLSQVLEESFELCGAVAILTGVAFQ